MGTILTKYNYVTLEVTTEAPSRSAGERVHTLHIKQRLHVK